MAIRDDIIFDLVISIKMSKKMEKWNFIIVNGYMAFYCHHLGLPTKVAMISDNYDSNPANLNLFFQNK